MWPSKKGDRFVNNAIENITFSIVLDMQLKSTVGDTIRMFGSDEFT